MKEGNYVGEVWLEKKDAHDEDVWSVKKKDAHGEDV